MPAPLLVGPALWGANAIGAGLKTGAAALGLGAAYGGARAAGVNLFGGRADPAMYERRGLTPPRRPMGNLPPSARVPSQYPAGVPTGGIGGGNAGASAAAQWNPPAPPSPPPGSWSPAAQGNPRLPAGRNVAIVNPPQRAQNRALNIAAQNAGLPAWNWQAEENAAMLQAAQGRGTAAQAAREAQGGRGYIAGDNLPAALDQSRADYWQGADMAAWAAANPELARRAQERAGYSPQAATLAGLTTAAAAPAAFSGPVAPVPDMSFSTPTAGQMEKLASMAADQPGFNMANVTGGDFRPGPAPAPAAFQGVPAHDQSFPVSAASVLPGGGEVVDEAAQARLQDYLQRIKNLNPQQWNFGRGAGQ